MFVESFHLNRIYRVILVKTMAEQGLNSDFSDKILVWYDGHARQLPWRMAEPNPYKTWLSEIMLQQTTVAAVKDYFLKFVKNWPTVHDLANASTEDVMKAWAGLGYYARARNLHACAKIISNDLKGIFPNTVEELAKLPGIGPYTSAAIAAIAFDVPAAAIDGNVDRVISRYCAIEEPLPQSKPRIREEATALVPQKRSGDFAQALMDLGATICTPKSPGCDICPLTDECSGRLRGLAATLPRKAKKEKLPTRYGHIYWIENSKGEVLIRTRAPKGLLGGMTEFPSSDWLRGKPQDFVTPFAGDWKQTKAVVEHTFTHFHLELKVWKAKSEKTELDCYFVAQNQLADAALPSVMRKVVTKLND
jgi:A/G-specific adenine glycosylase